jgi:hypothetical protein
MLKNEKMKAPLKDDLRHELVTLRNKLKQAESKLNKWVSVDNRLPECDYGYFLVTRHHPNNPDLKHVMYSFYIKDRAQAREHNKFYSRKYQGKNSVHFEACEGGAVITHWMPLPQPQFN